MRGTGHGISRISCPMDEQEMTFDGGVQRVIACRRALHSQLAEMRGEQAACLTEIVALGDALRWMTLDEARLEHLLALRDDQARELLDAFQAVSTSSNIVRPAL
jgi:hypothetical protein